MSLKRNSEISPIQGNEGTRIRQYFEPANMPNPINFSLAHFTIGPGKRSKIHKMKSSEIYYVLEGNAILQIDKKTYEIKKDDSVFVPPNSVQHIKNSGKTDLKFLCIVEPAWKIDDETVLE